MGGLFVLRVFISLILLSFFYSCSTPEDVSLEQTLDMAAENRQELENVLSYYQDDSLKWKAACFLIENMCEKGTIRYVQQGKNGIYLQQEPELDLTHITAAYLIENIDLAFEVWRKYPWCKHLIFDEFCRKILPYRLKQEPLDHWRKFYYCRYKTIADSLATIGASMKDVVFYFNSHFRKIYIRDTDKIGGELSVEQIEKLGGGTCDHLALNAIQQMRAIGVPLNLDILPYHGKVNGGHAYNSFTDEKKYFFYFSPYERAPERNKWVAPLVQRICYELQPVDAIEQNRWNLQLLNRTLANVTSEYYDSRSVRLPVEVPDSIVYLATYNRGTFEVIAQSRIQAGISDYSIIPYGLLYFQVAGNATNLYPIGNPFITTKDSLRFIVPIQRLIVMNGLKLYDVKRELKLGKEVYTLFYWKNGWRFLKNTVSINSHTLDFGEGPVWSLFLIYGNTRMGRMQRPFLIEGGTSVYY